MSVHEDLTVAYHQQDTNYYCGAACAQMVLDEIGAGLLSQDDLYNENHSHSTIESGWATGPDGLQYTMNHEAPPGNPAGLPHGHPYFALDAFSSEDSISRLLVWTIHYWQVAPIALVFGAQHWIVVRGFTASAAPANYSDNTYSISGFDVNNPWPPVPSWGPPHNPALAPPPPHSATDGCGTGGNRGIADEHITYTAWHDTYMTGVTFGHWNGTFVAICDPSPPTRPGAPAFRQNPMRTGRLIAAAEAPRYALEGLTAYGLNDRKNYAELLRRFRPADGVLVQRLDHPEMFYYIVPVRESADVTPLAITVDALTGVYRESAIRSTERGSVFTTLPRERALETVAGRSFELPEFGGRLLVRKEALCQCPHLVWKPCRESLTPYYPFYMFSVGSQKVYVRTDGAVFTALHDADRGI
jgi:hypothetical protein